MQFLREVATTGATTAEFQGGLFSASNESPTEHALAFVRTGGGTSEVVVVVPFVWFSYFVEFGLPFYPYERLLFVVYYLSSAYWS